MDGVSFYVFAIKEQNYALSLMSTYRTIKGKGKTRKCKWFNNSQKKEKSFKYPEVVHNHYLYCNAVDSHNAYRV